MIVTALFTCLCLKEKLALCPINCHIHAVIGNCPASLQVLPILLRLISVITALYKNTPPKKNQKCQNQRIMDDEA